MIRSKIVHLATKYTNMFSVLIDTSAYEALRLSFKGDIFDSLKKLSDEQKITIVGSDILKKEMEAHLKETIAKSVNKLGSLNKDLDRLVQNDFGLVSSLLADTTQFKADLFNERCKRINDYFDSVIYEELDISKVDNNKILNDYFHIKPPFGEGNKRKEFPDAFILNAFIDEYGNSLASTCMISQDVDWKKFAAQYPNIRFFDSIAEFVDFIHTEYNSVFMASLKTAVEGKKDLIVSYLEDVITDNEITIDDVWIDPEIELDPESVTIKIIDFNVISFESESAKIDVKIHVTYKAWLWAYDETASYKDDDTKSWVYFGQNQYSATVKKEISVEIEVGFDPHPNVFADTLEVLDSLIPDDLFYVDDEQHIELVKHWNDNDDYESI